MGVFFLLPQVFLVAAAEQLAGTPLAILHLQPERTVKGKASSICSSFSASIKQENASSEIRSSISTSKQTEGPFGQWSE